MKRYVESVLTPRKRVKALLMLKEFVLIVSMLVGGLEMVRESVLSSTKRVGG